MRDYTCKSARGCGGYDANACENCGAANPKVVGNKTVSMNDYVMALAMNHNPATVIVGNTKIPVMITDVESDITPVRSETKFTCQIVNLDQMLVKKEIEGAKKLAQAFVPAGSKDGKALYTRETVLAGVFAIDRVYFNDPVTVVLWKDDTKTIVRCQEGDTYSPETGLALCFAKKALGNKGNFNDVFKKHIPED